MDSKTTAGSDGADGGGLGGEDLHAGVNHFTEDVDFVRTRRGKIEVVIRLQGNVLRQITALEQSLKVNRDALTVADEKAPLQIRQLNSSRLVHSGFQPAGTRDSFNEIGRASCRERV